MRIKIDNNKYILVEKISFADEDSNIKEEISITVADENNQPLQDIARVRKSENKENNVELSVRLFLWKVDDHLFHKMLSN